MPNADPYLLPMAGLLTAIGLTEIYRLGPSDAFKQGLWIVIGVALFAVALIGLRRDYRVLESYKYLFGLGAIVLLFLPRLPGIGTTVNGARLWVHVGALQFQPGELAKIFLIVFLAAYLREKREVLAQGRLKDLGPLLLIWGATMLVLVETNDLGSALLYFGIFLAMLYIATARLSFVAVGLGLFVVGGFVADREIAHVHERVTIWLQPWTTQKVYCPSTGDARAPAGLPELPAREVALLDRERRLGRHRARQGHVHDDVRAAADPVREHRLHLLGARAGARADRRLGAAARLHALRRARDEDRAPGRRRLLEAARGRARPSASRCRRSSSSAASCG